jgi:CBS domain-containing protein
MGLLKIAQVPPPLVELGASVLEAVEVMAERGVGAVGVVENGMLRGIFTERDVMLRVVLRGRDPKLTLVRDVMTAPPETVSEDTTEEAALVQMVERHVRHLPIVAKDGRLQAMLSIRNLLEYRVDELARELHSLDQYLLNDGPGG